MMSVLAGCITVASAALVDAGIDCVDLVSGGVAALVKSTETNADRVVLDPSPSDHDIAAACVVGYLQSRDEVTQVWLKGDAGAESDALMDQAVKAATLTRNVLADAVKESVELKLGKEAEGLNVAPKNGKGKAKDVDMAG